MSVKKPGIITVVGEAALDSVTVHAHMNPPPRYEYARPFDRVLAIDAPALIADPVMATGLPLAADNPTDPTEATSCAPEFIARLVASSPV